jgi:hypothetical protein
MALDEKFGNLIAELPQKYMELISMPPFTISTIPRDCPVGGIYLFTENGKHLYAGRTKRSIKTRLQYHVSKASDCPFAWHLAREATGNKKATYKVEGSRKQLLANPEFKRVYESSKERIRNMEVRYVSEPSSIKQALLEVYVAVVSGAKYNDFDTH